MLSPKATAILKSWARNPALDAALIRGKVPLSARPKMLAHTAELAAQNNVTNINRYAVVIIENYYHNPIFELTPEDRLEQGFTPIQPG